jgi:hypothetical protein
MTEADIAFERERHSILVDATIPFVYQHRQQDNRVLQYEQVFQQKKKDFLKIVKTRSIRPVQ